MSVETKCPRPFLRGEGYKVLSTSTSLSINSVEGRMRGSPSPLTLILSPTGGEENLGVSVYLQEILILSR